MSSDKSEAPQAARNTNPFTDEMMSIKGEEVVAFFSEFDEKTACPICGCEDMELMAAAQYDDEGHMVGYENRPAIVGMTIDDRPDLKVGLKSPAFVANCDRCGYLAYMLVSKFLAWKRKNEDTE